MQEYDVIIAGASFAGLAVVSRLRGRILLLDKKEIGTGQTSACGITLNVLDLLDCWDSLQQVWKEGFIHTPRGTIRYDFPYFLGSFDYATFCRTLARSSSAEFLKARVLGIKNGEVVTDAGLFRGKCLVDATGWRAVLAAAQDEVLRAETPMSLGIETTVPYRAEGIHFYFDRTIVGHGFGWVFPCGDGSRVGIGSYSREPRLKEKLGILLSRLGTEAGEVHGGFFPCRLRAPTSRNVFLVGDAAGECEPLSGFGIRPSLYFGFRCADIIQEIIDGKISLDTGLRRYRRRVAHFNAYYRFLEWCQVTAMRWPEPVVIQLMRLASVKAICHDALGWHWQHHCLEEIHAVRRGLAAAEYPSSANLEILP